MAKTKKRAKTQEQGEQATENVAPVAAAAAPAAEAPKEKAIRVPKAIAFNPQGEVKAAKQGSKLAALIDALVPGATIEQLVKVLSQSGSAVDASGVRSWLTYDLRRTGLGVHQVEDQFFLVGTPLPHRDVSVKKDPEPKLEGVSEPKQKKVAMTAGRSKKARAAKS